MSDMNNMDPNKLLDEMLKNSRKEFNEMIVDMYVECKKRGLSEQEALFLTSSVVSAIINMKH